MVGNGGERCADLLGFNHAEGFAIDKQKIIAGASCERHFPDGDAAPGRKINGPVVLHEPAACDELRINLLAGDLFRIEVRHTWRLL